MSHYVKTTTLRRITFAEGHVLHGLEMRTKGADLRFMAKLVRVFSELQDAGQAAESEGAATPDQFDQVADLSDQAVEMFASKLVSWNMQTEDGQDVPATAAGIASLDDDAYVMELIKEWLQALAGVRQDLGKDSGSGEINPVLSLPMDVLSPSPAS